MCKCCQSCLESCYWHCFEKWFCYDESIALYEDPSGEEKDRRSYDNVAFWDSVSVIANRSIVTIQPLPEKIANNQCIINNNTSKELSNIKIKITNESETKTISLDTPVKLEEKVKVRKQSAVEDMIEKRSDQELNSQNKNRKKSLKERRKSATGLILKLENDFHEIPVIRQSSVPRFFLDTPQMGTHGNYSGERNSVLISPSLGSSPTFNYDLKSIVQIENEIIASNSKPVTPKSNHSSRLTQVKKKIKPIIKKPSTKSLPDSINYL